jgi:hypothetical protein
MAEQGLFDVGVKLYLYQPRRHHNDEPLQSPPRVLPPVLLAVYIDGIAPAPTPTTTYATANKRKRRRSVIGGKRYPVPRTNVEVRFGNFSKR